VGEVCRGDTLATKLCVSTLALELCVSTLALEVRLVVSFAATEVSLASMGVSFAAVEVSCAAVEICRGGSLDAELGAAHGLGVAHELGAALVVRLAVSFSAVTVSFAAIGVSFAIVAVGIEESRARLDASSRSLSLSRSLSTKLVCNSLAAVSYTSPSPPFPRPPSLARPPLLSLPRATTSDFEEDDGGSE